MTPTHRKKGPPNEMGRMAQRRFNLLHVVTIATELKGRFRCAIWQQMASYSTVFEVISF